ncbi:hypothetical protein [Cytobacillus gottheilii]|uniref:Flp pilus assembly protein TadB n=1 Tax=Cytobacillus gottheilii TaxID=859144 RepID=A0ABX8FIY8_9BACI|nr:hypothetical protein [Cytobacillus gottheilii]QVY63938.1 hypothetical protein J1899_22455 [Cytobacillus gottheilii]
MEWFYQNSDVLYVLLVGSLLYLSYLFLQRAQFDERRKSRYRRKNIIRKLSYLHMKLHNEEHELFLRQNGVPSFVTSERINTVRFGILIIFIVIVILELITKIDYISDINLILWVLIAFCLTPKKKYPLSYLMKIVRQKYHNNVSNEIYQLYNEIKSNFQLNTSNANSYYIIQEVLPYYSYIKAPLEKMLPYLEKKQLDKAWDLFEKEISIKEAAMLSIVMKQVESTTNEQALLILEKKRQEFSNDLYNRYTEYLSRKKTLIFIAVVICILPVFYNELVVFFMWYKEVMSVGNQMV